MPLSGTNRLVTLATLALALAWPGVTFAKKPSRKSAPPPKKAAAHSVAPTKKTEPKSVEPLPVVLEEEPEEPKKAPPEQPEVTKKAPATDAHADASPESGPADSAAKKQEPQVAESPPNASSASDHDGDVSRRTKHSAARPKAPQIRIFAAFETSLRRFQHESSGPTTGRSYHAFPIPAALLAVEAYPGNGWFGFDLSGARSFGVESTTFDGKVTATTWTRIEAALDARFFTANRPDAPAVTPFVGYGFAEYGFERAPPGREIPSDRHHAIRIGLGVRIPVDRFALLAAGEYERLVAIAPLGVVPPTGGGNGVVVHGGARYSFTRWLSLGLDVRYANIWFGIARSDATGVLDQYLSVALGPELAF